ncbi:MAG: RDD family protein [Luteolibacter sp.]
MTKYQTFWPRFCAGCVDGLVFLPVGFIDSYFTSPERGHYVLIVWSVISYSLYWLYSVLLHARYGQTIGKWASNVKVLDLSEERVPTLRQAFIRDIGYIVLNTLTLTYLIYLIVIGQYSSGAEIINPTGQILAFAGMGWFLLEIISMATNSKRRAFHDYIAGTVVVRSD